ncbi:DUF4270 domain-containing protein [Flavobacterium sp. ALJ2]|uniref:DUF4270 domain-containing protein n=1 Tax=Flavobacterium sp. ALJ2 TaxID=2786960 RepID=UPI00189F6F52|nr:DUF4270 domain-containing protein [Flavobacterium sp. ALJ2]MBF7093360.1 DUF4270 domain-containing protein [Flavobacterium sp. ALJ2]
MHNTSFFRKILLVASVVFLYSCDKDFNVIGDDLIGDNHFDLATYSSDILAYNQQITSIQSNNLTSNHLGIYVNPAFGTTVANFATQVTLAAPNPTIGESPTIQSVELEIPYYSHIDKVENGKNIYILDSIYGPVDGKMNLSIYESGYYMPNLDPDDNFVSSKLFFTDDNSLFDIAKVGARLNNGPDEENINFRFSPEEITEKTKDDAGKETVTKRAPAMKLKLSGPTFQKMLNSSTKLATNDVFKEYFRGLYFKVESNGGASRMATMDFKKGKITIKYRAKTEITTDADETMEDKTLVLNLSDNTVNLLQETNLNPSYNTAITTPKATGDEKLYLKGGEGSMAILELFKPGELEEIRSKGWLINEANLIFNIDSDAMKNSPEPNRIYLYDFNNNRPIVDYYNDGTSSATTDAKKIKQVFSGILNVDPVTKKGSTYKIRITNHVRNLIKYKDSTNVKMGIAVTEDINIVAPNKLKGTDKKTAKGEPFTKAPRASVMNPLGTILHGGNSPDESKRLKLQIYYTKPN